MNYRKIPVDAKDCDVDSIVQYFEAHYYIEYMECHTERNEYYCGITNDVSRNLSRHGVAGYTACVECGSFATSSAVEEKLGGLGFDIGTSNNPAGNGGVEASTIVYMVYKEASFKP